MALQVYDVSPELIPIVAIISTFVLFPLAIGVSRYIWRRASDPPRQRIDVETAAKLERMQQSIDAMAIEIERISEGQRFVTKVLSQRAPEALPRESEQRPR